MTPTGRAAPADAFAQIGDRSPGVRILAATATIAAVTARASHSCSPHRSARICAMAALILTSIRSWSEGVMGYLLCG